jgi:uncharacterized protein (DUF2141 family)
MIVESLTIMQKIIVFIVTFFLLAEVTFSQSTITANISNLRSDKGTCKACLFNSPATFKNESGTPFQCVTASIKNKIAEAQFESIPAGTYALFVFHDENSNNKMDKNFIGIPKEGYGASKNKLPFASAPSYDENKFEVENKRTIRLQIKLRNLY